MDKVKLTLASEGVSAHDMEELLETLRPLLSLIYRDRVIVTITVEEEA